MLGSGPKPCEMGMLWTKVSQLNLSSKSRRSERPFALMLVSEVGAGSVSRAGGFCPAAADPGHAVGADLSRMGRAKGPPPIVRTNSSGVWSARELCGRA